MGRRQLGRPVIKAFNTIRAQSLFERGRPAGSDGRIRALDRRSRPGAKQIAMRLVEELGLDHIDAGTLDEVLTPAARAHPHTVPTSTARNLRRALAKASPERPDALRGQTRAHGRPPGGEPTPRSRL